MRAAAATAGMLSAVMLLAPGCRPGDEIKAATREEPVRRAAFRSLVARDFLASCPGGGSRPEMLSQAARYTELKQFGFRKGAGHAIWLGENDFGAVRPHSDREPCEAGEEAYREALASYAGTLDALAGRVAEYRE